MSLWKERSEFMKKYLLPNTGKFYKANLHCHSTMSDGKYTPKEMKEMYKAAGYDIVAFTDHDVLITHDDLTDDTFLALNGFEAACDEPKSPKKPTWRHVTTCHMGFISLTPNNKVFPLGYKGKFYDKLEPQFQELTEYDDKYVIEYKRAHTAEYIKQTIRQGHELGYLTIINHPTWSKVTVGEILEMYEGVDGIEMVNSGCENTGHLEYNPRVYDEMLRADMRVFCINADDSHSGPSSDPAYTMIKAERLDYEAVAKALKEHNFYATYGPKIKELWFEDGIIHIECSPVMRIEFTTGRRRAKAVMAEDENGVCSGEFTVMPDDKYVRVTITDFNDKNANTNAYFTDTLFEN